MNWFVDEWESVEDTWQRVENVKNALWFAKGRIPSLVLEETGMAAYEAVKGIIPALLASLAFVALTTIAGAGVGALIGSLGAGVGAIPVGAIGAAEGFQAGLWILNIVGLAFLVEHIGSGLWDAVRYIDRGIRRAWGPTTQSGHSHYHPNVSIAADDIAHGVAIIIRCILEGIVLYLTKKGADKLPELLAKLKRSKLGEDFAVWVETNYGKMLENPKINPAKRSAPPKPSAKEELVDAAHEPGNRMAHLESPPKAPHEVPPRERRVPNGEKPKNSPDPEKWVNKKGGTVWNEMDGTWVYKDAEGNIVRYPDGYPDFSEGGYVRQSVDIDTVPNHSTDFVNADKEAPLGPKLPENTWHHHQNGTTMQEVNKVVHSRFTHRGGVSIKKAGE